MHRVGTEQVQWVMRSSPQRGPGYMYERGDNQRRTPLTCIDDSPKSMTLHVHVGVGSRKR
eukprot:scaffold85894_cov67-Phaeocystis_antarctica.AAC.9